MQLTAYYKAYNSHTYYMSKRHGTSESHLAEFLLGSPLSGRKVMAAKAQEASQGLAGSFGAETVMRPVSTRAFLVPQITRRFFETDQV